MGVASTLTGNSWEELVMSQETQPKENAQNPSVWALPFHNHYCAYMEIVLELELFGNLL